MGISNSAHGVPKFGDMKHVSIALLALTAVAFAFAPPKVGKPSFTKDVKPTLDKFCIGCHSGAKPADGIDFSKIKTDADAKKSFKVLRKSLSEVQEGAMPPRGMTKPSAAQVKAFAAWVKAGQ